MPDEEKHYDEVYRPYGGATSFAELESQKAMNKYVMEVDDTTYSLRCLMENIMSNPETSADEKAAAISTAAEDYRKKIASLEMPEGTKSIWDRFKEFIRGDKPVDAVQIGDKTIKHEGSKWVIYSKDGEKLGSYDSEAAAKKRLRQIEYFKHQDKEARGFKIYEDKNGDLRWLSFSSNAFEDRDKELFTTKALEEAVEYGDKTGERGPLLLYHVPSAEIGHCDFQSVIGRFLVESGTFDDTPLGQKAVDYFIDSDEDFQVSIGFEYLSGDEEDGVFDWLRTIERSVTPNGAAANPWTSFKLVREGKMLTENKTAWLKEVFGEDMAKDVIANADSKTKELEAKTRFKEKTEETTALTLDDVKALVGKEGDDLKGSILAIIDKFEGGKKEEEAPKEEPKSEEEAPPAVSPDFNKLAEAMLQIHDELVGIKETLATTQAEVKEMKKSDDEKVADIITPRWKHPANYQRPSESDKNVVTPDSKEAKDAIFSADMDEDPATKYVRDLIGIQA